MSAAPPIITITGEVSPDEIDPMMAAIRQSLVDAGAPGSALAEFGEHQVVVVPPDATDKGINAAIDMAMAKNKGLCLLLITGSGKNPDTDAPGPVINLTLEAQLFVSTRIRGKSARAPLALLTALAKFYHHAEIEIRGIPWYERIKFLSFDPLEDPDFTAYSLTFEREMSL